LSAISIHLSDTAPGAQSEPVNPTEHNQIGGDGFDFAAPRRFSRRQFAIGGVVGGVASLTAAGFGAYDAYARAPFEPVLERIDIRLPPRHADMAGLTIGFIADTHLGPSMGVDDIARATALLAAARPDLVLLGGDYISASPRYAGPVAEVLKELVRVAPLGSAAVLGNHDCGENGRDLVVTTALEEAGIPVLRNRSGYVDTGKGVLWIAGVDEAIMARADPRATFAGIPEGAATIAIWHEPDYAGQTAMLGAFAQLSGHSHGGQVRLPGFGPLFLPKGGQRYVIGLNRASGMPVYTTRGVGVFVPPVRINCPPEVTLITLIAA
jgi:predicted MPP superfamily phosphohydrolase